MKTQRYYIVTGWGSTARALYPFELKYTTQDGEYVNRSHFSKQLLKKQPEYISFTIGNIIELPEDDFLDYMYELPEPLLSNCPNCGDNTKNEYKPYCSFSCQIQDNI